jgi:hypothetical protein
LTFFYPFIQKQDKKINFQTPRFLGLMLTSTQNENKKQHSFKGFKSYMMVGILVLNSGV